MKIIAIWMLMVSCCLGQVAVTDTALVYFANVASSNYTYVSDGTMYANVDGTQYVDGVAETYVNSHYSTTGNDLYVGGISNHTIVDFRAYTDLTSDEVADLYARPWILADDPDLVLRTCVLDKWDYEHVTDVSGNGNVATNYGVELNESADGWVGAFDGVSDSISFAPVIVKSAQFIFSFNDTLVRPNYFSDVALKTSIASHIGRGSIGVYTYNSGGNAILRVWPSTISVYGSSARGAIEFNTIYDCCVVQEVDNDVVLYIDGSKVARVDGSLVTWDMSTFSTFGKPYGTPATGNYPFNGDVYLLKLYSDSLASNDVYTLSQGGTITNEPVANWTMQPSYLDTGDALTGVAPNYGTGADGTYSNSPTAASWTIQHEPPFRATINID